jgi:carbonic anhydrase
MVVKDPARLPATLRGTPVEQLMAFHNLGDTSDPGDKASLLIVTCMDPRVHLRIPPGFAFVLRTGGGNLQRLGFPVSFAIGVGGVRAVALIGHDDCGLSGLAANREPLISGVREASGCDRAIAQEYFDESSSAWDIGYPTDFLLSQARQLRMEYPGVIVTSLFFRLSDQQLYLVGDGE